MDNEDDAQIRLLLERIAARDEQAMRELHRRYARRIHAFAMSRMRDSDAAETVVIDTLHEVWRHPDRFRGESRFSTWLLGIARYKLLTLLRQRDAVHEDIDDHGDSLVDPSPSAPERIEEDQRMHLLARCMEALNAPQREAMQLTFVEGMGLAEIAQVQNVPEGTVKSRLFHARRNLRGCVEAGGAS